MTGVLRPAVDDAANEWLTTAALKKVKKIKERRRKLQKRLRAAANKSEENKKSLEAANQELRDAENNVKEIKTQGSLEKSEVLAWCQTRLQVIQKVVQRVVTELLLNEAKLFMTENENVAAFLRKLNPVAKRIIDHQKKRTVRTEKWVTPPPPPHTHTVASAHPLMCCLSVCVPTGY